MALTYLSYTDFYAQIRKDILEDIAEGDNIDGSSTPKIDTATLHASSEAQSYLRTRYNVAKEFAYSGASRNAHLVMLVVDMSIYHLYAASNLAQVPIDRVDRYNNAIKTLKMVMAGDLDMSLEYVEDEPDSTGLNSYGSNCQQSHEY